MVDESDVSSLPEILYSDIIQENADDTADAAPDNSGAVNDSENLDEDTKMNLILSLCEATGQEFDEAQASLKVIIIVIIKREFYGRDERLEFDMESYGRNLFLSAA